MDTVILTGGYGTRSSVRSTARTEPLAPGRRTSATRRGLTYSKSTTTSHTAMRDKVKREKAFAGEVPCPKA
jgi:hypothetical protein